MHLDTTIDRPAAAIGISERAKRVILGRPLARRAVATARDAVHLTRSELAARRPPQDPADREPRARFQSLYERDDDPWGYAASRYERRKHALTVAALPAERYEAAFEPGCSFGHLTLPLADRCDSLLAADVATIAVERTRRRLANRPNVVVERRDLPDDYPNGTFDLILFCELGYYLEPAALDRLLERMVDSLTPGGHLLAVHGRGITADLFQPGDVVHRKIRHVAGLRPLGAYKEAAFRLELFSRR